MTTETTSPWLNTNLSLSERVEALFLRNDHRENPTTLNGWIFRYGNPPGEMRDGMAHMNDEIKERLATGVGAISYPNSGLSPEDAIAWINAFQDYIQENTRLKIPAFICDECSWGHVALEATEMPSPPAMAATFDPELVERIFRAGGREAYARGSNLVHSPVGDIGRDPRWGAFAKPLVKIPIWPRA